MGDIYRMMKESADAFFRSHWNELKPEIKRRWIRITDDDLMIINGDEAAFIGNLQAIYRITKDEAERQYRGFLNEIVQHA